VALHTVNVTRQAQQVSATPGQVNPPGTPGVAQNFLLSYTQVITASGGTGMPNEIFKLNLRPVNPTNPTGPQTSDYQGVCTPYELQNLLVGTPGAGQTLYRTATVTLVHANQSDADGAWAQIETDVQTLVSALIAADRQQVLQVFTPVQQ
jgi:hypothetical protein